MTFSFFSLAIRYSREYRISCSRYSYYSAATDFWIFVTMQQSYPSRLKTCCVWTCNNMNFSKRLVFTMLIRNLQNLHTQRDSPTYVLNIRDIRKIFANSAIHSNATSWYSKFSQAIQTIWSSWITSNRMWIFGVLCDSDYGTARKKFIRQTLYFIVAPSSVHRPSFSYLL